MVWHFTLLAGGLLCTPLSILHLDTGSPPGHHNRAGNVAFCRRPGHCLPVVTRGVSDDHGGRLPPLHHTPDTIQGTCNKNVITQISHLCITTSGFEGASLLEVFTFEEELFASSEAVEGVGGEDWSVVEVTGHPAGSCLYVRQCDAHGEGEGGSESCVLKLRTVSGQSDLESVKNRILSVRASQHSCRICSFKFRNEKKDMTYSKD